MKLVMTLLVRDEEDVLRSNLESHLAQGVDFFIITDNLSVDGTRDIIEEYVRDGVAACLDERADDYSQAQWVTRMARLAASRYGADWIINSDADEFWIASSADGLKRDLACVRPEVNALVVSRSNFLPVDEEGGGLFAERMMIREHRSHNALGDLLAPKVCHRAFHDVEVDQGNHRVSRNGINLKSVPGRLRILHYPLRSYRQFENKISKGGAAYARNARLEPEIGKTWRYLYACWQAGGLRAYYRQMMLSAAATERGLRTGELVYDDTLLAILRQPVGADAAWQAAIA